MPKPTMVEHPSATCDIADAQVGERGAVWDPSASPVITPLYARDRLMPGQSIFGPSIVEQMDTTILIGPGEHAEVDGFFNLIINLNGKSQGPSTGR